jgi:hypothetical protein
MRMSRLRKYSVHTSGPISFTLSQHKPALSELSESKGTNQAEIKDGISFSRCGREVNLQTNTRAMS